LPDRNLVLVVDDDPGMLKGIQRLLLQHAYEPVVFSSAEAFKNHADIQKAVCVILDINLNDGSGIELRYHLKANGYSMPVIYHWERQSWRPDGRTSIRMSSLSHQPFSAKSLIEPLHRAAPRSA